MRDSFHYEVPVETVPIPSAGRIYPEGTALHGLQTVDIRAMTAREEDILMSRALIKKGEVISALIRSCLIDKTIDVDSMIAGDRNALMIAIRITGYGREYSGEIVCKACGEKGPSDFDLANLKIKRLEIDPVQEGQNAFKFTLPVTKKEVLFRFLTGADEQDLIQSAERKKKVVGQKVDTIVTDKLQRSIIAIDGLTDK